MHEEWTDQLSDYLDDELSSDARASVEQHLRGCVDCRTVLNDLKRVVAQAQSVAPRPPQADLWPGIAGRLTESARSAHVTPFVPRERDRVVLTWPQLAAAAVVLASVSAGISWNVAHRTAAAPLAPVAATVASSAAAAPGAPAPPDRSIVSVVDTDPQYDAAVAELETAVRQGRGRLDAATIATVEHNLQIIDQAIAQARDALGADPANSYLSGHLVEARRRKLDLLRRAAELTSDTN